MDRSLTLSEARELCCFIEENVELDNSIERNPRVHQNAKVVGIYIANKSGAKPGLNQTLINLDGKEYKLVLKSEKNTRDGEFDYDIIPLEE